MIIVYGKDSCPKCDAAIKILENNKAVYNYVNLSLEHNAEELEIIKKKGHRSVPVIMLDDKVVSLEHLFS